MLTRRDVEAYVDEVGIERDVNAVISELVRLGWLTASHSKGVWLFLPPGENEFVDPYVELRAWAARDEQATFALAGEAAAWHLGYLDRWFDGPIALWMPKGHRPPPGLRPLVSVVRLGWDRSLADRMGPTRALLRRRGLDLISWASGLPAFGPEALLAQVAIRPGSFRTWADLVAHLPELAADCDLDRLVPLLHEQSSSSWQRAAYLLYQGERLEQARVLMAQKPSSKLVHATIGDGPESHYSHEFEITDRLVALLQDLGGKA